jgi:putative redox protein
MVGCALQAQPSRLRILAQNFGGIMAGAVVTWQKKMSFIGKAGSGFSLPMDTSIEQGGDNSGFRPMEILLVGLGGCTGMDVISILEKKRQNVTSFEIRVSGERAAEHPKVYTSISLEYVVGGKNLDPNAVERAVTLSEEKYCSVMATLSKTAKIDRKITIVAV